MAFIMQNSSKYLHILFAININNGIYFVKFVIIFVSIFYLSKYSFIFFNFIFIFIIFLLI